MFFLIKLLQIPRSKSQFKSQIVHLKRQLFKNPNITFICAHKKEKEITYLALSVNVIYAYVELSLLSEYSSLIAVET